MAAPVIDRESLLAFMRQERYAAQASVSAAGAPQAAIVGIVVSDRFEVFFDTLASTRKAANLRANPRVAFVIGPAGPTAAQTVQFEGVADEPSGPDLERLLEHYFARFPDGRARQSWPGLIYMRIKPTWIRYSDFLVDPPAVIEFTGEDLLRLAHGHTHR